MGRLVNVSSISSSQRLQLFKSSFRDVCALFGARSLCTPNHTIGANQFVGRISRGLALSCNERYNKQRLYSEMPNSIVLCRNFSTSCPYLDKEQKPKDEEEKTETGDDASPEKPLTQRQKLSRTFAAYGSTAVVFHTTISLASLGTCYMIVSSGVDMVAVLEKIGIASKAGLQSTLASGASTFVIAYACHKVFMPLRIFLTVTCTPIIVRKLRSLGLLRAKAKDS